jgi:hypothetical protein
VGILTTKNNAGSIKRILLFVLILYFSTNVFALDSDEEDDLLTPEDDLIADILAQEKEQAKKEKASLKFKEIVLKMAQGSPVLDGELDDPFWLQGESIDLDLEVSPNRLGKAKLGTKVWLVPTSTHIYVAFDASDPNPDRIRSARRAHDGGKEDDYVSIIFDTVGNGARSYEFRVNPHGSRGDAVFDKVAGRSGHDWDADWDAAAKIYNNGYRIEMAIPITAIRSPKKVAGGRKGLVFFKRYIPRRLKTVNAGFVIYDAKQYAEEVDKEVADTASVKKAVLDKTSGSVYAIFDRIETRKVDENNYEPISDHDEWEAGLDLHYRIDLARSIDFTVNPNFTQVETDIARDGLSKAFKKFKPEKRPFFKPVTEYYTSSTPAVYTRNIIQPTIGAVYTMDNAYTAGSAFIVDDEETEITVPDTFGNEKIKLAESSNSSAFRYRGSNDDGNAIGVLGTLRTADGYHNAVTGVDGLWDIDDDNNVRYQFLVSNSEYPERFAEDVCEKADCLGVDAPDPTTDCLLGDCSVNAAVLRTSPGESLTGHHLKARYKNSTHRGEYFLDYLESSPDFRGDLGFMRQVDYRLISGLYAKKWYRTFLKGDGGRSRIKAYVNALHGRSYEDNTEISTKFGAFIELSGSFQSKLVFGRSVGRKAVGRIDNATLAVENNAPLFDEDYWIFKLSTSPYGQWSFDISARIGDIANKHVLDVTQLKEFSPKLTYRFQNFEFGLETIFRDADLDGTNLYKEDWYTLKAFWRPNNRISHRLLYLYDKGENDTTRLSNKSDEHERDKTVEYTFTYKPNKKWSFLTGAKGEYDSRSSKNASNWVKRQAYIKLERHF